jgi:hypothetical protein
MSNESIKTSADKIVEKYRPHAFCNNALRDNGEDRNATRCAILEVEACMSTCNKIYNDFPVAAAIEHHTKYNAILQELKSRIV